jgi:hypothetical protein
MAVDLEDEFELALDYLAVQPPFISARDLAPEDPNQALLKETGLRVRKGATVVFLAAALALPEAATDPAKIVEHRELQALKAAAEGFDLEDDSFGDDAPEVTRVAVAKAPVTGDLLDGCTFDGLNGPDYLKQQEESTAFALHPLELAPTRG